MTAEARWTVVVLVLSIAGVVALWPRDRPLQLGAVEYARPQVLDQQVVTTAPPPDDVELAAPRARAGLQPCPAGIPVTAAAGPLLGVVVPCLGEPGGVDLAAALAGRPALLNLWASWCQPCREELPVLDAYAGERGAVTVVEVNVRDRPADALSLLAALGVDLPSVTDPDGRLQGALRAPPVLPMSFVLRADGSVVPVDPPRVFRSPGEVRRALAEAGVGLG